MHLGPRRSTASMAGVLCCLVLTLTSCAQPVSVTTVPAVAAVAAPRSWIGQGTLLSVYGRAFGTAPILGRLGMDHSFADVDRQVAPYVQQIEAENGHHHVQVALHLIYGLATTCAPSNTCLLYLDDAGIDIVKQYIQPAAKRGWLVILDDQLGRSTPVGEALHIVAKGYLQYDNVEVAFDPEFRMSADQVTPGIPVGHVSAGQLNAAEGIINAAAARAHLPHRKLMLVHQWTPTMISTRRNLQTHLRYVQPVIVMDGIGQPADKLHTYNQITRGPIFPHALRGIKLFPTNPYELAGHVDMPVLNSYQLFGHEPAQDDQGRPYFVKHAPHVIVLT